MVIQIIQRLGVNNNISINNSFPVDEWVVRNHTVQVVVAVVYPDPLALPTLNQETRSVDLNLQVENLLLVLLPDTIPMLSTTTTTTLVTYLVNQQSFLI